MKIFIACIIVLGIHAMFNYKPLEIGIRKIHQIEKRFGFRYGTPLVRTWPCLMEVLMLMDVDTCGAFFKAGFERGDVIHAIKIEMA